MKRVYFTILCLVALIIFYTVPYLESIDVDVHGFHFSMYEIVMLYVKIFGLPVLAAIVLPVIVIWLMRKYKNS